MARNRVIGQGNRIPWHLPEDFKWFKSVTMGHTVVMGRKTFESIGKPLPGRDIVVLSRSGFGHPGVRTLSSLDEVEPKVPGRDVFIAGGAEIYVLALPYCSDLYLTRVEREVQGDAWFPPFEEAFELAGTLRREPEFIILHYKNARLVPRTVPDRNS